MRKFFSFRSSASGNENSNPAPPAPNTEKVYWETPWENNANILVGENVQDGSRTPKDAVSKLLKRHTRSEDSSNSCLRRSHSFSYPAVYSGTGEGNLNSLSDLSRSPSSSDNAHHVAECPTHFRSLTPERHRRTKRGELAAVRKSHLVEKLDSPSSSRGCQCSSGNSPCSSSNPLRCRVAHLKQISNKHNVLDLYIDGEHQGIKHNKDSHSDSGNDGLAAENRAFFSSGLPPRSQSTAPSSPTCSKEKLRIYPPFRVVKDIHSHLSTRDWIRDDCRIASPQKPTRKKVGKPSHAFPGKPMMKEQNYDSETTTTVEDIYEDSSDPQPILNSSAIAQKCTSSDISPSYENVNEVLGSLSYENINGYCTEEVLGFHRQSCVLGDGSMGIKHDKFVSSEQQEQDTDEDLLGKVKEAEERFIFQSEGDFELEKLRSSSLSVSALLQKIRNITEDRRYLALELSSQIKCRLAERSSAKEGFSQAKLELDTRTRRLEKEKNELQLSLEKELDRRSNDWSLKLEKFQLEEQRLRERVRELAEQNVSLQREVSSLKGNEVETQSRITNSEMQLKDLTVSLEEERAENCNLHQALMGFQVRCNGAEGDRDCIRKGYKEKEKENKELQKAVVRLQRICSEQEKTISGLRQEYSDEIAKQLTERGDHVSRAEMEQLRLTGVEQMLRRELESCRLELEFLRHENICLLNRLQGTGIGFAFSSVRLDQELRTRVDHLQTQALSLLDDNSQLCGGLLEFMKRKHYEYGQEANSDFDAYSVVEYNVKYQSLRRRAGNLRKSLQTVLALLDEKSSIEALECQSQTTESGGSRQQKVQASEDEMELELKAETIITRVLREKLCSKELELEQLEAELSSSVRGRDVLQNEIQRLQDELSCLSHKKKDLELQMLRKEESISQLQLDLQGCTKELTAARGILKKVSEERDCIWEEVKQSRETNMLLNYEVNSLRKKNEALDEDILIKEGQIAILKDSLGDKPFDILYSPKLMKELALE